MIDNKQTENIDFSSPTTIIIIVLIFIIIMLIFTMDTFGNTKIKEAPLQLPPALNMYASVQLPPELNMYAVLNYIPQNSMPPILSIPKSSTNILTSKSNKTIYIVCNINTLMDRTPYCLLDLGYMSINKNNITINNYSYKYNSLDMSKPTIISCIIKDGVINAKNFTTPIIDNIWLDMTSNIIINNITNVSVGKTLSTTNPFNGYINQVLIYNTAVTPKQHNSILLTLASYHKIQIPMDFTQMNGPYVGSQPPYSSSQPPCTIS